MAADISQQPDLGPVRQFSIFVENKVGRLNEMVESLAGADVHIMALCLVDTTDSTIIRIVVDYPERAEQILDEPPPQVELGCVKARRCLGRKAFPR